MITAIDISEYLQSQSDFDLELFVYRSLLERGIQATHGGTYTDPITQKPRQFDIRARMDIHAACEISFAIECKSLSTDFPLLVCRVPRPPEDSFHEVIRSWGRANEGEVFAESLRPDRGMLLYPAEQMVGKKTAQIRREAGNRGFKTSDGETHEKWAQALASAWDLVRDAVGSAARQSR